MAKPLYALRIDLQRQSLALREAGGNNWRKIASKIEKIGRKLDKAIGGVEVDRRPDDQMTKFLDGVIGCVEADSFARFMLWKENEDRAPEHKREWSSNNTGLSTQVGILADHEVWVSLQTAIIGGHKILFYSADGRVVDHDMVRSWLECRLPKTAFNGTRLNNTDAMNFHNIFPYEPPKQEPE